MNVFETLPYLVKVNLYWVLFYACYWLLFRKHTFFRWNRFYLISTLLISWVLPLIELPAAPVDETVLTISDNAYNPTNASQAIPLNYPASITDSSTIIEWSQILTIIYLLGFTTMAFQLLKALNNLRKVIVDNTIIHFEEYAIVLLDSKNNSSKQPGSFSFFKWLFLTKDDYEHHLETILTHEMVHIKQLHSWDIVLVELLKVVFWFNPILWLYKNAMQEVHEFLADEEIPNRNAYSNFLVSYALNAPVHSLTNHFFNSRLLKIRIHMIYKHRTSRWLLSKYSIIIPVAFLAVFLTAARERVEDKISTATTVTLESQQETSVLEPAQFAPQIQTEHNSQIQPNLNIIESVSIKGVILDKFDHGIVGAIVIVKNSTTGAATDENGRFELKDIPANSVLVVSHLHYNSAEISLETGKTDYKKVLDKKDANSLHEVVVVAFVPPVDSQKKQDSKDSKSAEFVPVESYPEFPGGPDEMYKYIARNVKYPTRASKAHIQGRVILSFTIDIDGKTSNAKIVKGIGYGMDEEAVRVIYNMPKWNPALQNGKPIAMEYTLPIMFALEEEKTSDKRQGSIADPENENLNFVSPYKVASLTSSLNDPLVVLNGVAMPERGTVALAKINTTDISSISVIRGESATTLYGKEGVNGVVMVKTREAKPKATFMNYQFVPGKIIRE